MKEPLLFTPGPLTTSMKTKKSMLVDYGSWDDEFNAITAKIRKKVIKIVKGNKDYTCVPLQGSGSFGVEAMIINFVRRNEPLLILINGAYGERIEQICKHHKIKYVPFVWDEDKSLDLDKLKKTLDKNKKIKHLAFVHCETSTGILNPLKEVSDICKRRNINLYIDAMSSFGALDINANKIKFKAVVASPNKCLEGVPGINFVIAKTIDFKRCKGISDNLSMDLHDQWNYMETTGRWRYTPPTHVVAAFLRALEQFEKDGGLKGRAKRYNQNLNTLITEMTKIGFKSLLPKSVQTPIIVTFISPTDKKFKFDRFYNYLKKKGFIIYPGKMAKRDSFRIGCIGFIGKKEMKMLTNQIAKFVKMEKISLN